MSFCSDNFTKMAFNFNGGKRGGARGNASWDKFEKDIGNKRTKRKSYIKELTVMRVAKPEGKQGSRYQPCGDRVYVPFTDFDGVTIDNVSQACESYFNAPAGSCRILASNTGPVCFRDDQEEK